MNNHEILKSISFYVQRDNGVQFTETSKMDRIRKILNTNSKYKEIYTGALTSIWVKDNDAERIETPVLLTSHIDNVKDINHPFVAKAVYNKIGDVLAGTFDNTITNAALVDLMCNQDIDDSIVFCFDGDEETGQCRGLREAVHFVKENEMFGDIGAVVSTDVTDEGFNGKKDVQVISQKTGQPVINKATGNIRTEKINDYDKYKLFSLENMTGTATFQENFCKDFLEQHTDDFSFAPHPSETYNLPECMKDKYNNQGFCDEAYTTHDLGLNGMSICLPIKGEMHSDKGCITRPVVYDGYCQNLGSIVNMIASMGRDRMLEKDEALEALHEKPVYTYGNYNYGILHSYDTIEDIEGQMSIGDYLGSTGMDNTEIMECFEASMQGFDDDDTWNLMTITSDTLAGFGLSPEDVDQIMNDWYEDWDYNYAYDENNSFKDFLLHQMDDFTDANMEDITQDMRDGIDYGDYD